MLFFVCVGLSPRVSSFASRPRLFAQGWCSNCHIGINSTILYKFHHLHTNSRINKYHRYLICLTPAAEHFPIGFLSLFFSVDPLTGETDGDPGELLLELGADSIKLLRRITRCGIWITDVSRIQGWDSPSPSVIAISSSWVFNQKSASLRLR